MLLDALEITSKVVEIVAKKSNLYRFVSENVKNSKKRSSNSLFWPTLTLFIEVDRYPSESFWRQNNFFIFITRPIQAKTISVRALHYKSCGFHKQSFIRVATLGNLDQACWNLAHFVSLACHLLTIKFSMDWPRNVPKCLVFSPKWLLTRI